MSPKQPRLSAREMLRALRRDGWTEIRQRGSHVILEHPTKPGTVVVPAHAGKTLKTGTLASILRDAGLTLEELRRLL